MCVRRLNKKNILLLDFGWGHDTLKAALEAALMELSLLDESAATLHASGIVHDDFVFF